jgi:hypothetical protein
MRTAHGFYHELGRCAYPQHARSYWREQASSGCATGTLSGNDTRYFDPDSALGLAMMIDAIVDEGLVNPRNPMLILSATGKTISDAKQHCTGEWPEIVICGIETPSMHDYPYLQRQAEDAHEHGLRFACTICAAAAMDRYQGGPYLGEAPDIWIVQGSTFRASTASDAASLGKELWSYFCNECHHDYDVLRYYSGLWCWARQPKQALLWTYAHDPKTKAGDRDCIVRAQGDKFTYAVPREDGTVIPTRGYEGFVQGIEDCRLLERAEELGLQGDPELTTYMGEVRASVAYPMFRRLVGGPPVDMGEVTRRLTEMGVTP